MGLRQAERSGLELSQGESLCHQYGDRLGGRLWDGAEVKGRALTLTPCGFISDFYT